MRRSGFTLVELSIVLVIIGLIIGGVMASQELVRGSELNRILTDKDRISAAINAFRNKYSQLPGDMRDATDYWGSATACPAGARTGTQTCNGNGDGQIGGLWDGNNAKMVEMALAMQHMALAGFIQGNFVGYSPGGSFAAMQIGTNAPVTSVQGGTFMIYGQTTGLAEIFGVIPRNALFYGATNNNTNVALYPILTVSEAQSMDSKVDDGRPGLGNVLATIQGSTYAGSCSTTAVASTANYDAASAGRRCPLVFNRR